MPGLKRDDGTKTHPGQEQMHKVGGQDKPELLQEFLPLEGPLGGAAQSSTEEQGQLTKACDRITGFSHH